MKKILIFVAVLISANVNRIYSIWELKPHFTNEEAKVGATYIKMNSGWFEGMSKTTCGSLKLTPKSKFPNVRVKSLYTYQEAGKTKFKEISAPFLLPLEGKAFKFDNAGARPGQSYAIFCYGPIAGLVWEGDCNALLTISEINNSAACSSIKADFDELKMNIGSK